MVPARADQDQRLVQRRLVADLNQLLSLGVFLLGGIGLAGGGLLVGLDVRHDLLADADVEQRAKPTSGAAASEKGRQIVAEFRERVGFHSAFLRLARVRIASAFST